MNVQLDRQGEVWQGPPGYAKAAERDEFTSQSVVDGAAPSREAPRG